MIKGKISVIIPVYNTQDYLKDCIESILNIKNSEIEIIAVNDGSTDDSLKILKSLEAEDTRVKVYNKSNSGVSDTRNAGIEKASGEWITFVDSDDMIDAEKFDSMLSKITEKSDLDMVFASFYYLNLEGNKKERIQFINKYFSTSEEFIKNIQSLDFFVQNMCSKLYKTEIIKRNKIKFDEEVSIAEDGAFNVDYYKYVRSIQCVNEPIYLYRLRPGSLANHVSMPSEGEGSYKHYLKFIDFISKSYNVKVENYPSLISFFINMGVINKIAAISIDKERDVAEIKEVVNNEYVKKAVNSLMPKGIYRKIVYRLIKNKSVNMLVILFKIKFFLLRNKKIYSFVKLRTAE